MSYSLPVTGRLLTRNAIWNLAGQAVVMVVGIAVLPYVVRNLGPARFGVLSMAWVLLSYFSLFDLGLGRATTKFAAECLGRGEESRLADIVWTTVLCQLVLGIAGMVVGMAAADVVVYHVLKPGNLAHEMVRTFFIVSVAIPFALPATGLRGCLEASQRFDLVNFVKIPNTLSLFVIPAVALSFGLDLPGIAALLVVSQILVAASYVLLCIQVHPVLRTRISFHRGELPTLLTYGGWVTVSSVVGPLLTYMDRFFIGSVLTLTAVGYYTAPYDAINRAWVIPGAITATLFPAISTLDGLDAMPRATSFVARAFKTILLLMAPGVLLTGIFARVILSRWLGPEYAANSTEILQLLAVGVLIYSLATLPFSVLHAVGRADVTGRIHLAELPIYAVLLWGLLHLMGVKGAAVAWLARVVLDAALLFGATARLKLISFSSLAGHGIVRGLAAITGFGAAVWMCRSFGGSFLVQMLATGTLTLILVVLFWRYVLDGTDRSFINVGFRFWRPERSN